MDTNHTEIQRAVGERKARTQGKKTEPAALGAVVIASEIVDDAIDELAVTKIVHASGYYRRFIGSSNE